MILYNPTHEDLFTDNFWIPTVMLEGPEPADTLLSFLGAHASVISTWRTGHRHVESRRPDDDLLRPAGRSAAPSSRT